MTALVRRDSALFTLAVELFVRHRSANGYCPRCGPVAACLVQRRTAEVILAANVDVALLESPKRRPESTFWQAEPTTSLPVHRSTGSHDRAIRT